MHEIVPMKWYQIYYTKGENPGAWYHWIANMHLWGQSCMAPISWKNLAPLKMSRAFAGWMLAVFSDSDLG